MTTSKAHHRSYTINLRALTPAAAQSNPHKPHPSLQANLKSHKPSKSTPNAIMSHAPDTRLDLPADSLPQHNRELTLRRYMLLQDEHESIRQHLDQISTPSSSTPTNSTTSPTLGPTRPSCHVRTDSAARRASMPQYDMPRPRFHRRAGARLISAELEMSSDPATLAQIASEEAKLLSVNEGIKRALTELLNCETVRSDQAFRSFCMTRLMETEQELRGGRRRRSCPIE
ncbi:hypothetical protein KVR01_001776 [Diaporthe batatas]|uniref:uncharacterized protein n=1 Tax=Diaporthe batatas TaxID=748121 RepID=UPI001D051495|nr:uncharacterized protein KVR01_001776 [Diaporthe batatas]KAG8169027.1 hypothetical protein KVR01_001776 [Diaporthe batatas]